MKKINLNLKTVQNKKVACLSVYFLLFTSILGQQLEPKNSAEIDGSGIGMHTLWVDLGPVRRDITEKMFEAGVKWYRLGVPWSYVEHESIGNYYRGFRSCFLYRGVTYEKITSLN
jgi:hypothetical protein